MRRRSAARRATREPDRCDPEGRSGRRVRRRLREPISSIGIDRGAVRRTLAFPQFDEHPSIAQRAVGLVEVPRPDSSARAVGKVRCGAVGAEGQAIRCVDALDHLVAGQIGVEAVERPRRRGFGVVQAASPESPLAIGPAVVEPVLRGVSLRFGDGRELRGRQIKEEEAGPQRDNHPAVAPQRNAADVRRRHPMPILPANRVIAMYFVILDVDPVKDAVLRVPDWPLRQLGVAIEDAFDSSHAVTPCDPFQKLECIETGRPHN